MKYNNRSSNTWIRDDCIWVNGCSPLLYTDFPAFVEIHLHKVFFTRELEERGIMLIENNFHQDELKSFIWGICRWGGSCSIFNRVIENNRIDKIRNRFLKAFDNLSGSTIDIKSSIENLTEIFGLGVSYASKHLRFLQPKRCPVFDSQVSEMLDYRRSSEFYEIYSNDCCNISEKLRILDIRNPMKRGVDKWYSADVDMVLFAWWNGWRYSKILPYNVKIS